MSRVGEPEEAMLDAGMENGEHEESETETVEVPREEFEALVERVEELEELLGKEFCEREDVRNIGAVAYNANEKAYELQDKFNELEDKQRVSDSEPSTKVERVRDRIVENFDRWSVNFKKGRAVATDVSKGQTKGAKKSVAKWVKEVSDEDIQHKTVYDGMERVEKDYSGYEYEEVLRNGETKRYVWRVKE